MRLLLQRVKSASVTVNGRVVGKIGPGFLILAGFRTGDTKESLTKLAEKCVHLRVFEDEAGKMNRSIIDIGGSLLIVSQFTLYADCRKGRRPSFTASMVPDEAERFFEKLFDEFGKYDLNVEKGIFGAKMDVSLINDGPVTIMLDDREL